MEYNITIKIKLIESVSFDERAQCETEAEREKRVRNQ